MILNTNIIYNMLNSSFFQLNSLEFPFLQYFSVSNCSYKSFFFIEIFLIFFFSFFSVFYYVYTSVLNNKEFKLTKINQVYNLISSASKLKRYMFTIKILATINISAYALCFLKYISSTHHFQYYYFKNHYSFNDFTLILSLILVLIFIILFFLGINYNIKYNLNISFELIFFYSIFITLLILALKVNNFLILLILIETIGMLTTLLLVIHNSNKLIKIEVALKYFTLTGIVSTFLILGIFFFNFTSQSSDFNYVQSYMHNLNYNFFYTNNEQPLFWIVILGISFIMISFLYKLTSWPLHSWAPDVYQGIPLYITATLSILPKAVYFIVLLKIFLGPLADFFWFTKIFFFIAAIGSLLTGSLGAILQKDIKKFLAYTSIAQIGWIFLGVSVNTVYSITTSISFYVVYLLSLLGIFICWSLNEHVKLNMEITYFNNFIKKYKDNLSFFNILYIYYFMFFIISLLEMPPLYTFWCKFAIIQNVINANWFLTGIFCIIMLVIGTFYYLILLSNFLGYYYTKNWFAIKKDKYSVFFFSILTIILAINIFLPLFLQNFQISVLNSFYLKQTLNNFQLCIIL
jgi:NADH-quinone oxidoreductase subunit N